MHPNYPNVVFACAIVPPPAPNGLPIFVFFLWERGVASYYRYSVKKQGDKTPTQLMKAISNPANWTPSDPDVRLRSYYNDLHLPISMQKLRMAMHTDPQLPKFLISKNRC
jgi:hypothetical protein